MNKKENSSVSSAIDRLSIIRATQLSKKHNLSFQKAMIMGRNSVNNAILLNKFLCQNREYLISLGDKTSVGYPSFEIILSAVCGIEDGWGYWKFPHDIIVAPSLKTNSALPGMV